MSNVRRLRHTTASSFASQMQPVTTQPSEVITPPLQDADLSTKRRPPALTFILTIGILANVAGLTSNVMRLLLERASLSGLTLIDIGINLALLSTGLAGLGGIWHWKRWGVFTYAGAYLVGCLIALVLGLFTIRFFVSLAVFSLVIYLVRSQWSNYR